MYLYFVNFRTRDAFYSPVLQTGVTLEPTVTTVPI
jgi:hypothetical protein